MIRAEDGEFVAPAAAPFAAELIAAGWKKRGDQVVTTSLELVAPFVEHFCAELLACIEDTAARVEKSLAMEPSPGFPILCPLEMREKVQGFQAVSAEFIVNHDDTLLAQECGTGKTAMMIMALNVLRPKRVLIICPAVAKYNWMLKEWPKWNCLPELSIGVVESDDWSETDIVIINYDILDRHKIAIQAVHWDVLLCDEAHKIKSEEAIRSIMTVGGYMKIRKERARGAPLETPEEEVAEDSRMHERARELCAKPMMKKGWYEIPAIRASKRVFATATPMNRPKDLWHYCKLMDNDGLGRNQQDFWRRYCGGYKDFATGRWYNNGSDNLEELGAMMRSKFMVRHPEEVLKLPPHLVDMYLLPPVKIELEENEQFVRDNIDALIGLSKDVGMKLSPEAKSDEFLKVVGEAVINNLSLIGKPEYAILFEKFAEIREKTGLAKVPHVVDYIRDKTDDGAEPLVCFGYHRSVLKALHAEFSDQSVLIIGGMSSKKRFELNSAFQNGEVQFLFGNIDSAGEALDMTRTNQMTFAEMDWRATQLHQAMRRIKRLTQEAPMCFMRYLISAYSFDYVVSKTAFQKFDNIERTLEL